MKFSFKVFNPIDISDRLYCLLKGFLEILRDDRKQKITVVGGGLTIDLPGNISITTFLKHKEESDMNETFTLPNDTADLPYSLAAIDEIKDAEGEVIASFVETFESSAPDVVAINGTDPRNGSLHIGRSGTALVVHSVKTKAGRVETITVVDAKTFIVTTGNPLVVTGGGATITGAEPDPVEPPPSE